MACALGWSIAEEFDGFNSRQFQKYRLLLITHGDLAGFGRSFAAASVVGGKSCRWGESGVHFMADVQQLTAKLRHP